jgi:REP element-mobilizing transposase RayT
MKSDAHSENLRRHRLSDAPATFFITKSLHPKKPVLDEDIREIIVSALAFAVQEHRIYMRAFVVMLDHWHALFALCDPWTLPRFMHMLMSFIGAKTSGQLKSHNTFWQDGYYDTRVRTAKQFAFVANYIEQNPVTKGLAGKSEKWHASSAKRTELITASLAVDARWGIKRSRPEAPPTFKGSHHRTETPDHFLQTASDLA